MRRRLLKAAVAYYASRGITVERVMTENGACYKVHGLPQSLKRLGLKHIRTRPYTRKTNGKAERHQPPRVGLCLSRHLMAAVARWLASLDRR